MKFIFDTGSAWTWVPNSDCTGCPGNHYNYAFSEDYYQSQYTKKIFYGVGSVKGYVVNDDITVAPPETGANAMAHNVNFISVYESEDLFGLMSDGLLGLSPRKSTSGQDLTVHLLVDELKNDGVIDKAMFAFDLRSQTDYENFSKVTFGGYDRSIAMDRARPYRDIDDFGEPIVHWMEQDSE